MRAAGVTIPDGIQLENVLGASDVGKTVTVRPTSRDRYGRVVADGTLEERLTGFGMALIAAWVHVDVLIHPDAQGALAYFYLPILLLVVLPLGYGLGRALAKLFLPRVSP